MIWELNYSDIDSKYPDMGKTYWFKKNALKEASKHKYSWLGRKIPFCVLHLKALHENGKDWFLNNGPIKIILTNENNNK